MSAPNKKIRVFDIAALLVALRERRGLSQAEMADLADFQQSEVCRWENGVRAPSLLHLHGYAVGLGERLQIDFVPDTAEAPKEAMVLALSRLDPASAHLVVQLAQISRDQPLLRQNLECMAMIFAPRARRTRSASG